MPWLLVGSVVSQGTAFVCSLVAARMLGKSLFGELAMVQSTALTVANVAGAGIGITATRYVAEFKHTAPERVGALLALTSIIAAVAGGTLATALYIFAPAVAGGALNAPHLEGLLRVSSFYLLFITLNGYQLGALVGLEAFDATAALNSGQALAALLLTTVLTPALGVYGAVLALTASAGAGWLVCQVVVRRKCRSAGIKVNYRLAHRERHALLHFALPAAVAGVVGQIGMWASNALVVRGAHGFSELAAFNAANAIRQLILFAPTILSRVAFPVMCRLRGRTGHSGYRESFNLNLKLTVGLASAVAVPLVLCAPTLLAFFGRDFRENGTVLVLLSAAALLEVSACAFYQAVVSFGRLWWHVGVMVAWSLCLMVITKTCAGFGSAVAMAVSYVLAWTVSACAYAMLAARLHRKASYNGGPNDIHGESPICRARVRPATPLARTHGDL